MRKKYHFFVYRCVANVDFDCRCPIGGITALGTSEIEALHIAFDLAYERFPCRPREMFVVVGRVDRESKRQVFLLEQAWKREMADFEELMGV